MQEMWTENEHEKNKDHGRNHKNNQSSMCKWNLTRISIRRVCLSRPTFYTNREDQYNEMRRMIKARWQAFGRHNTSMKDTLPTCLKERYSTSASFQQ